MSAVRPVPLALARVAQDLLPLDDERSDLRKAIMQAAERGRPTIILIARLSHQCRFAIGYLPRSKQVEGAVGRFVEMACVYWQLGNRQAFESNLAAALRMTERRPGLVEDRYIETMRQARGTW